MKIISMFGQHLHDPELWRCKRPGEKYTASSGSSIRHEWWAIVGDALSQEIAVELGKR